MALESRKSEMLCTDVDAVSLQLWVFVAEGLTAELHNDVVNYRRSSTMTEKTYSQNAIK